MFIQFMRLTNCHSLIFYSNLFTCTLPPNPPLKFSIFLCLTVVARVNNNMNLLNGQPFSLYRFLLFLRLKPRCWNSSPYSVSSKFRHTGISSFHSNCAPNLGYIQLRLLFHILLPSLPI